MPGRIDNGTKSSRFELPALDLNFGSITDGTNIPPPPKSPVEKPADKSSSVTAATTARKLEDPETAAALEGKPAVEQRGANGNKLAGTKRPADDIPPSPTMSSTRSGGLRRLLSRTLLNNSYAEGQQQQPSGNGTATATAPSVAAPSINGGSRPPSRTGASSVLDDDRKSKRSSGWFRRLRGGDLKRSSLLFEQSTAKTTTHAPSGPPPPMIPELKELEKDDGSLGQDLFKNIK
ncbi:uncharacterized protein F5Z01DRAFT_55065 [Emericellopsis atlantica]|uniref:Uncharacterized protein n=1 Tax=Emericellopsis atlantica TaxID=2614577 RepID=A0A9P8CQ16_9HYPO|nr:uncharacterized protein F5Z01DRAFT_55065 [Emericellopsis atlantica]KAG9255464.1 hypothetical protein F5Z01DRAFT_55065 [Emericellopsis atlantica]